MEILIYKILKSGFFGFFDRSDMRIYGKILISGLNEKYPLDEGNVKFSLFFFFNFFQLRKSRNKKKLFSSYTYTGINSYILFFNPTIS